MNEHLHRDALLWTKQKNRASCGPKSDKMHEVPAVMTATDVALLLKMPMVARRYVDKACVTFLTEKGIVMSTNLISVCSGETLVGSNHAIASTLFECVIQKLKSSTNAATQ
jgi:hypothetical protein